MNKAYTTEQRARRLACATLTLAVCFARGALGSGDPPMIGASTEPEQCQKYRPREPPKDATVQKNWDQGRSELKYAGCLWGYNRLLMAKRHYESAAKYYNAISVSIRREQSAELDRDKAEVRTALANLFDLTPKIRIKQNSQDAMARKWTVMLDDQALTEWGQTLELDPGKHTVAVSVGSLRLRTKVIVAQAGETQNVDLDADDPPTPAHEHLRLAPRLVIVLPARQTDNRKWAVSLDGKLLDDWGYPIWVVSGEHKLTASVGVGPARTKSVTIGPGEVRVVDFGQPDPVRPKRFPPDPPPVQPPTPTPESCTQRGFGMGLEVAGISTLALATGLGITSAILDYRADNRCNSSDGTCTERGLALNEQAKATATAALFTAIVGAAALGTGIGLYVTAAPTQVSPQVARSSGIGSYRSEGLNSVGIRGTW